MSDYYIAKPGTQQPMGPFTIEQIRAGIQQGTITPDCVYCVVGMKEWKPLAELPGLSPTPAARPVPGANPTLGGMRITNGPRPDSGLAWSIVVTILCCNVFGILAIVHSARCNALAARGDYAAARRAADSASTWRMWSVIAHLIGGFLYLLCIAFLSR